MLRGHQKYRDDVVDGGDDVVPDGDDDVDGVVTCGPPDQLGSLPVDHTA